MRQYHVVVDPVKLRSYGLPLSPRRRRDPRLQHGDRRPRRRDGRDRVHGARPRLPARRAPISSRSCSRPTGRRRCCCATSRASSWGPTSGAASAELNGEGEAVGGIALQRFGQNALDVIDNVKAKLAEIAPSLPEGVRIETVYDRSELIQRAIDTLKTHADRGKPRRRGWCASSSCCMCARALVAIVTLPVGVLMAFIAMHALGINSNIMSLGGIAIAIGAMVDAAIVMIENAHKHLERAAARQAAQRGHRSTPPSRSGRRCSSRC